MFRAPFGIIMSAALLLLLLQPQSCWCYEYRVGDLDCWGIPPHSKPLLYTSWSVNHRFHLGDSLLFLYPPSQDSVIQVTARAFNSCSLAEPPLQKLHDGNSVFNLTAPGYYYFTSGVAGHCEKDQKLVVAVPSANGTFLPPPADGGSAGVAAAPGESQSYPIVFGPTPAQGSSGAAAATAAGSAVAAAAALLLAFVLSVA
ncbi:early nodulin-like protein 1 [Canna indica]|uniref:Early nodulin-like protein 1 n=1 Tax=Canna indica TaxID=4628 RepID=A0AAQ3QIK0_9LILI|nr:early nodulin-like protein 1 [Canna indica]